MVLAQVAAAALLAVPFTWPDPPAPPTTEGAPKLGVAVAETVSPVAAPLSVPTRHARPRFLTRSYHAPRKLVRPGAGGMLRIPSLGVDAPVDAVGLDGSAMAVPNDPARIGWLTATASPGDLVGQSVLAGHVSDAHDRPGALHELGRIRLGAAVFWTDSTGRQFRFHVARIRIFPRSRGLPSSMFAADGPYALDLVTCALRVTTAGGGFHYTSNLVVSAVR